MNIKKTGNDYSKLESQQRLEAALRGAFKTPPLKMQDIPKKNGESRRLKPKKSKLK